jgi:hypothetical protein
MKQSNPFARNYKRKIATISVKSDGYKVCTAHTNKVF